MAPSKRHATQHVRLQPRDVALLAYLGVRGAACLVQVHRTFWCGRKEHTARDRLRMLGQAGYLHRALTDARGKPEEIFWLARTGRRVFGAEERARFMGTPTAAELAHCLRAVDIWDALARDGTAVDWTGERALKREKARAHSPRGIADARVTLRRNGRQQTFLVEIDGGYYGRMLRQKVEDLAASGESVLWVVYSDQRLHTLRRLCQGHRRIRPVLFRSLEARAV